MSQNLAGVWMHLDRLAGRGTVEPAEVTVAIVKAHEAMNRRDLFKCGVDGAMGAALSHALNADANQRSKPGLSAFDSAVVLI